MSLGVDFEALKDLHHSQCDFLCLLLMGQKCELPDVPATMICATLMDDIPLKPQAQLNDFFKKKINGLYHGALS